MNSPCSWLGAHLRSLPGAQPHRPAAAQLLQTCVPLGRGGCTHSGRISPRFGCCLSADTGPFIKHVSNLVTRLHPGSSRDSPRAALQGRRSVQPARPRHSEGTVLPSLPCSGGTLGNLPQKGFTRLRKGVRTETRMVNQLEGVLVKGRWIKHSEKMHMKSCMAAKVGNGKQLFVVSRNARTKGCQKRIRQ